MLDYEYNYFMVTTPAAREYAKRVEEEAKSRQSHLTKEQRAFFEVSDLCLNSGKLLDALIDALDNGVLPSVYRNNCVPRRNPRPRIHRKRSHCSGFPRNESGGRIFHYQGPCDTHGNHQYQIQDASHRKQSACEVHSPAWQGCGLLCSSCR